MVTGGVMAHLRRVALAAQVWLTAVMTVVAGVPRFDCVCSNGQSKQARLGFTSPSSGCCCQRNAPDASTPKACCAKPIDQSKRSKSGSEIDAPSGCQRALADQEPLTV